MFNGDKLYMLPSVTPLQCMGFVLAGKGDVLAVDGGTAAETDQLENLLLSLGGKVTCWLLTHAHFDHIEALIGVLERGNVEIGRICYQFPDSEYIERVERQENRTARAADLENAIARRGVPVVRPQKGQWLETGHFRVCPFPTAAPWAKASILRASSTAWKRAEKACSFWAIWTGARKKKYCGNFPKSCAAASCRWRITVSRA